MTTNKTTIPITVDFDVLKHCHPTFELKYHFLLQSGAEVNNVKEELSLPYLWNVEDLVYKLEFLFNKEYKLSNWQYHRDHFLYITDIFLRDETLNYELRRERKEELKGILRSVIALRRQQQKPSTINTILIDNHIKVEGKLIVDKTVKLIEQELINQYTNNQVDNSLPTIEADNLKELEDCVTERNVRTTSSADKMLGYLSFVLKSYMEEYEILKSKEEINIKSKKLVLKLSNDQGNFICLYLELLGLISNAATPGYFRVRRYINRYLDDIDENLQLHNSNIRISDIL